MESLNEIVTRIDDFVWGPVMLILLVGTGIFLTVRTRFLTWRNLGYALKSTLSKEARTKSRGEGDVSPFSALTTALAATRRSELWRIRQMEFCQYMLLNVNIHRIYCPNSAWL